MTPCCIMQPMNAAKITDDIYDALCDFADDVTAKSSGAVRGEPEEQLRAPFEAFMRRAADAMGKPVECVGEIKLPNSLGKPDYGVKVNGLVAGYAELKAPGKGVTRRNLKGRDRSQFDRFTQLPNVLYTDGNQWALYIDGKLVGDKPARMAGDVSQDGRSAIRKSDAARLTPLLSSFLNWQPVIPRTIAGKVDWKAFAVQLARLCKYLRDDVLDAMQDKNSPLHVVATEWRKLLFPTATDEQFADAYAQTVVFALLLGRSLGAGGGAGETLDFTNAKDALQTDHILMSTALSALVDPEVEESLNAGLNPVLRLIDAIPTEDFSRGADPWIFFYENFLAEYDPKLRKDAGVYYTPVQVVSAQVRLIDDLLVNRLAKPQGFADADVVTLDPAIGTGTYLLGVIRHALARVAAQYGEGAVAAQAAQLASNLYGFELMVGPYAISELRVSGALKHAARIYLTDTLESPHAQPPQGSFYIQRELARQQRKALRVKKDTRVLVCLGNPPYDRAAAENSAGGWVRRGDEGGDAPILEDFLDPARKAGHGVHLKNLYNLYVYFWRWALWKVFEQDGAGPGVVSFISASSYLKGDAFAGMREHMRRECDEIWILDIGGESRGPRKSENVFNIQTPVAIAVAMRNERRERRKPAKVHYSRVNGSREEKLHALDRINDFKSVHWQQCPDDWQALFAPAGTGAFFAYPLLTDLMPWQHSGAQLKRTWPIAPDADALRRRWQALLNADDRATAFREDRDRKITHPYNVNLLGHSDSTPISELPADAPPPPIRRYAYRFLDRQHAIADGRIMSFARPPLWESHSDRQLYLTTLTAVALDAGPALAACSDLPDICHFLGSFGAKDTLPLYRAPDADQPNITPGLLNKLSQAYGRDIAPEDFAAYLYGVMAHPDYARRFYDELETCELRVPLTKNGALFSEIADVGARLLRLHTYGQRYVPRGEARGIIPVGAARCAVAVPQTEGDYPEKFSYSAATQTLRVGGGEFAPVTPEIFEFQVSGRKPLQSWLKYRMKDGTGRKSSPLDDIRPGAWTAQFTTELLQLIWTLEATIAEYPKQAQLLDQVVRGDVFAAADLPAPPPGMRKPPKPPAASERLIGSVDIDR